MKTKKTKTSKITQIAQPNESDRLALRMLVRVRADFQAQRKRMDNRIGRKADGTEQDIEERVFRPDDLEAFASVSDASRHQEKDIEKRLNKMLKRFPIWNEWLSKVKGVGPMTGAVIISSFDIHKATTVSKLWQYAGLNPGLVRGKIRHERPDGGFDLEVSNTMIRGDRMTKGFVCPFNKPLRTALCGILADGFIKAQAPYAMDHYYPYKERLANSENVTHEIPKAGAKPKEVAWKDAKPGHRDRAAKRKMIKAFLQDLYANWRAIEGLPARVPYAEEYLGKKHAG